MFVHAVSLTANVSLISCSDSWNNLVGVGTEITGLRFSVGWKNGSRTMKICKKKKPLGRAEQRFVHLVN